MLKIKNRQYVNQVRCTCRDVKDKVYSRRTEGEAGVESASRGRRSAASTVGIPSITFKVERTDWPVTGNPAVQQGIEAHHSL